MITIDLSAVPMSCWLWTAGILYLLLMWTCGAVYTRRLVKQHGTRAQYIEPPLELRWFTAPVWMPFAYPGMVVRRFLIWVIYGSTK